MPSPKPTGNCMFRTRGPGRWSSTCARRLSLSRTFAPDRNHGAKIIRHAAAGRLTDGHNRRPLRSTPVKFPPMRAPTLLLVPVLALLVAACSTAPQRLDLKPTIDVAARNIGQGTPVAVQVVDRRPLTEAQRNGAVTGIDPAVNVVDVVYREATLALERLGFAVEPAPTPLANTLTLEVLQITYDLSSAVMKKTVFVDADIRAAAVAGHASYTTTYRAHQEQEVAFHPAPALSQRLVNQTVSNALTRAFADPQLMGTLARRHHP
ncbi:MAG TPA: hypothetical protein DIT63_04050 [Gammaproteobacteria bacterium]|nr:hypothetical protein [Gammaproteobacteria bacterium]